MPDGFARLIAGTRGRILTLLRTEPRTVSELAEQVGVSDNAVRTHLTSLQRDGLVEDAGRINDGGVGKPAQRFQVTEQGEEAFPKAYAAVLGQILRAVAEREGEEALLELLREVGRRTGETGRHRSESARSRLGEAVAMLEGLGADIEVIPEDGDRFRVEGKGCPLSAVVRDHAEACLLIESLIAEVTGGTVKQCCQHGDRPRCSFEIALGDPA